ncbi:MAG: type II toxin-antitoxin system RelB/DinJ family antitoxin [Chloroflexi bacterium]|nr:type II toxin-antitoxin system RelB/DinJ family antitoxin [Chloroflexota bacterium]
MNKTAVMSARVSPDLKYRTEKLFTSLGLTVSEAFNLFLNQADLRQGLPFAVEIPNEETRKAIEDSRAGIDLHRVKDEDELFAVLSK